MSDKPEARMPLTTVVIDADLATGSTMVDRLREAGTGAVVVGNVGGVHFLVERRLVRRALLALPEGRYDYLVALKATQASLPVVAYTAEPSARVLHGAILRGCFTVVAATAAGEALVAALDEAESSEEPLGPAIDDDLSLRRLESQHVRRVLQICGNNVSEASRLLGISRPTVRRILNG